MSGKTDSILDKDLYELFGVLQDASVKDIKTAYRKKALECHPDKNPDNPKANELFHELSRALAVLIDESARATYDKLLNAKLAAKKRTQVLDSKRKKFKEDLEERERLFQEDGGLDLKHEAEKFQMELERLRKLSSKQVEEELNYVRELMKERKAFQQEDQKETQFRLKLKWSARDFETNGGYNDEVLSKIFSKYGSVNGIVVSHKKKGSALIEFSDQKAAMNAVKLEKGLVENPLVISWVGTPPDDCALRNNCNLFRNETTKPSCKQDVRQNDEDDFEAMVLQKLREAERKKQDQS